MKNNVIPNRMSVSFQMNANPVPFNIIFFTITINHLAGIMVVSHCSIAGILSMGKIKPDRRMVGNIRPSRLINIAICCVFAEVEISTPRDRARVI